MKKWEYKIVLTDEDKNYIIQTLQNEGNNGWELVSIKHIIGWFRLFNYEYIFKREKI